MGKHDHAAPENADHGEFEPAHLNNIHEPKRSAHAITRSFILILRHSSFRKLMVHLQNLLRAVDRRNKNTSPAGNIISITIGKQMNPTITPIANAISFSVLRVAEVQR